MSIPMACPSCRADFRGTEIPADQRSAYEGQTHFSRVVGIYDHDADTTVAWICPDCGYQWPRTDPLPGGRRSFELVALVPGGVSSPEPDPTGEWPAVVPAPRRRWWQFWKRRDS